MERLAMPAEVLTALSERDAAIASTERRAGGGFAGDDHEHLTMSEAVRWYAGTITDATRPGYAKWPGSYHNDRPTKGTRGVVA
jgi:hypothetical protein